MSVAQPHPGIPIRSPMVSPAPGQIVVSYQIVEPELGCCKCDDLNALGIIFLIFGILVFWPIALFPCFMSECKTKSQMPVYGYPPGVAPPPLVTQQAPIIVHLQGPPAPQQQQQQPAAGYPVQPQYPQQPAGQYPTAQYQQAPQYPAPAQYPTAQYQQAAHPAPAPAGYSAPPPPKV